MNPFDENTDAILVHAFIKKQQITQAKNDKKKSEAKRVKARHVLQQTLKRIAHNDDRLVPGRKPSANKQTAVGTMSTVFKKRHDRKSTLSKSLGKRLP